MKEHEFKKEKVSSMMKISKQILFKGNVDLGTDGLDFINNTLTAKMDAYFWQMAQPSQSIQVSIERPRFIDWLLRRKRYKTITINIKDALIDPPAQPENTIRLITLQNEQERKT